MQLSDFDYELPEELIAQEATEERSSSRLLLLNREDHSIGDRRFSDIVELLPQDSFLVLNDTRVIPARIMTNKPSGGEVEVFLTRALGNNTWECMLKPAKRVAIGGELYSQKGGFRVTLLEKRDGGLAIVKLDYSGDFWENLSEAGVTPLPPYIKGELKDPERYQTVYAREKGSVAAPTAGLHFTPQIFEGLSEKGIGHAFVTLHVGPGTFRPVKVDNITEHVMDEEFYLITDENAEKIKRAIASSKKIVAVGTTSVRALESAFDSSANLTVPYGSTRLFVYPGYHFKIVDALITNFHLPKSTLIMLVSAFAGREFVLRAYRKAVEEKYRMYSLGDAMLIL